MVPYPILLIGVLWMVVHAIYKVLRRPDKSIEALNVMLNNRKTRRPPSDEGVAVFFLIFVAVMVLLAVL